MTRDEIETTLARPAGAGAGQIGCRVRCLGIALNSQASVSWNSLPLCLSVALPISAKLVIAILG